MTILDKIIEYKKEELSAVKAKKPLFIIKNEIFNKNEPSRSFWDKLQKNRDFHFICEIKKASPSKGVIQPDFHPVIQALEYEAGGASAISVLTDEHFFHGRLDYLTQVRESVTIPVLRKDFIFDEYQIYEAKAAGADMILLIARILEYDKILKFAELAVELKMDILLEISEENENKKIPDNIPLIIGINNRNLADFSTDLSKSLRLKEYLPSHLPLISESGIYMPQDCRLLSANGFNGALIGETLMRSKNPKELLRDFIQEVNHANPS